MYCSMFWPVLCIWVGSVELSTAVVLKWTSAVSWWRSSLSLCVVLHGDSRAQFGVLSEKNGHLKSTPQHLHRHLHFSVFILYVCLVSFYSCLVSLFSPYPILQEGSSLTWWWYNTLPYYVSSYLICIITSFCLPMQFYPAIFCCLHVLIFVFLVLIPCSQLKSTYLTRSRWQKI